MKIELKVLNKEFYEDNLLPRYATAGAAAVDLVATQDYVIVPEQVVEIRTGLAIWVNSGNVAALILPRSGRGAKEGLVIANTVGLIDSDYQGELVVYTMNRTEQNTIHIKAGERFAQMTFVPIIKAQFDVVEEFSSESGRGDGGFGSTGE